MEHIMDKFTVKLIPGDGIGVDVRLHFRQDDAPAGRHCGASKL